MNASKLQRLNYPVRVLTTIAQACTDNVHKSISIPTCVSFGQYFNSHPQEGILGTASAIISCSYHDPHNHKQLQTNCLNWLKKQHEKTDSQSNREGQFSNNHKYAMLLWALQSQNTFNAVAQPKPFRDEFISRMTDNSLGWWYQKCTPSDTATQRESFDLDSTCLALFVIQEVEELKCLPNPEFVINNFLKQVKVAALNKDESIARAKYLLSVALLICQNAHHSVLPTDSIKFERFFKTQLIKRYSVRGLRKDAVQHYDMQTILIRDVDNSAQKPQYMKILIDAVAYSALLKYYVKNKEDKNPFIHFKAQLVIKKLNSFLFEGLAAGRLFQVNNVASGRYALVDHAFLSFAANRLSKQLPRMSQQDKADRVSWIVTIGISIIILVLLSSTEKPLVWFWSIFLFPFISYLMSKIIELALSNGDA